MGDRNHDLKQEYRSGAVSPRQDTLDDHLVVPASSGIVLPDALYVSPYHGFAHKILSNVSQKASAAYDAVTPSPEFVRQHRGWTTGGLVGIGAGLTMAAAFMEPVKDAVVHTISADDVGLATIVGTALAGTMEYLWTYRSRRRK